MRTDRLAVRRTRRGILKTAGLRTRMAWRAVAARLRPAVRRRLDDLGDLSAACALVGEALWWAVCEAAAVGAPVAVRGGRLWRSGRTWLRRQFPWMATAALGAIGLYLLFRAAPRGEPAGATVAPAAIASAGPASSENTGLSLRAGTDADDTGAIPAADQSAGPAELAFARGEATSARTESVPSPAGGGTRQPDGEPAVRDPGDVREPAPFPEAHVAIRPVEATTDWETPVDRGVVSGSGASPQQAPAAAEWQPELETEFDIRVERQAEPTSDVVGRIGAEEMWRPGVLAVTGNTKPGDGGSWSVATGPPVRPGVSGASTAVAAKPPRVVAVSRRVPGQVTSRPSRTGVRRQQMRVAIERNGNEPLRVGERRRFILRFGNLGPATVKNARIEVDLPEHLLHRHGRWLRKSLPTLRPGSEHSVPLTVRAVAAGTGSVAVRLLGEPNLAATDGVAAVGVAEEHAAPRQWSPAVAGAVGMAGDRRSLRFEFPARSASDVGEPARDEPHVGGLLTDGLKDVPLARVTLPVVVIGRPSAAAATAADSVVASGRRASDTPRRLSPPGIDSCYCNP